MWWRHAERPLGTRTYTLQKKQTWPDLPNTPTQAFGAAGANSNCCFGIASGSPHSAAVFAQLAQMSKVSASQDTWATCSIVVAPSRQASSLPVQRLQSSMRSCLRTVGPVLRVKKWDSGFAGSVNSAKIRQTCVLACPERSQTLSEQTSSKLRCSYWFAAHVRRLTMNSQAVLMPYLMHRVSCIAQSRDTLDARAVPPSSGTRQISSPPNTGGARHLLPPSWRESG